MKEKGLKFKDKTGRYYQFGALAVAILMVSSIAIGSLVITEDGSYDTNFDNQYINGDTADYIVSIDGSTYYARYGSNGTFFNSNTDFSMVMQSCIVDFAYEVGGKIYIKPGNYTVENTIELSKARAGEDGAGDWTSIIIQGSGTKSTELKMANGANCNMFNFTIDIDGAIGSDGFKILRDMKLSGNKAYNTKGHGIYRKVINNGQMYDMDLETLFIDRFAEDGIHLEDCWGIHIENVYSENNGLSGFNISSGTQSSLINCFAYLNDGEGFIIHGNNIKLSNCQANNNGGDGFKVNYELNELNNCYSNGNSGNGLNVSDSKNIITNFHSYMDNGNGIFVDDSENVISNVYCIYPGKNGIHINDGLGHVLSNVIVRYWGRTSVSTYSAVKVSASYALINNLAMIGYNNESSYRGLSLEATYARVSNVREYGSDDVGIYVSGTDSMISQTSLTNGIDDSASRTIIDGVSYNAGVPGSAGNWASSTVEGVMVWDTVNSDLYLYCNSTWNQITLT